MQAVDRISHDWLIEQDAPLFLVNRFTDLFGDHAVLPSEFWFHCHEREERIWLMQRTLPQNKANKLGQLLGYDVRGAIAGSHGLSEYRILHYDTNKITRRMLGALNQRQLVVDWFVNTYGPSPLVAKPIQTVVADLRKTRPDFAFELVHDLNVFTTLDERYGQTWTVQLIAHYADRFTEPTQKEAQRIRWIKYDQAPAVEMVLFESLSLGRRLIRDQVYPRCSPGCFQHTPLDEVAELLCLARPIHPDELEQFINAELAELLSWNTTTQYHIRKSGYLIVRGPTKEICLQNEKALGPEPILLSEGPTHHISFVSRGAKT